VHTHRHPRPLRLVLPAVMALVLAGCASTDTGDATDRADTVTSTGETGETSESGFPVEVLSGPVGAGTTIVVEAEPTAIVSLSPTATEMLWALGAGDQVVAVDDQSDYPAGVPTTRLSGYQPNLEAVLDRDPDLVVVSGDHGDLVAGLDAAGVPALVLPAAADLDEAYSQMERLGAATGHVADAAALVGETVAGLEAAVDGAPDADGLTYFHELDPTLYSATGDTFIGEVYGLFGLTSIADAAGGGDDYPQLSEEYVVEADPDLVFLADAECCDVDPDDVRERPGWDGVEAVRTGQVYALDEDISSRWGPRVVEFADQVADMVAEQQAAAPTPAG
jgi:iron complex transport system substrate-binding protein